jgi:hypothetical protein
LCIVEHCISAEALFMLYLFKKQSPNIKKESGHDHFFMKKEFQNTGRNKKSLNHEHDYYHFM